MTEVLANHGIFLANIFTAGICTLLMLRFGQLGLTAWVTTQGLLANIFVLKQVTLFGLNVTAADVFTISSMFSLILVQELYDKQTATRAIHVSLLALLFFSLIAKLHLGYTPSPQDFAQPAYKVLFGPNFRIILASILAYYVSLQVNMRCYQKLQATFLPKTVQAVIAISIAQIVDTVIFGVVGLYGLIEGLPTIILFSLTIKMISVLCLSYVPAVIDKYKK